MKTKITAENPHGYNRYGFAWEWIPQGSEIHLDFGCHAGEFLETLKSKGIAQLVGVDISGDAVREAHERFPELEIRRVFGSVLPFEDGLFTSISILDVIEHVEDQRAVLDEVSPVLRDDGTLIVTVPGQHLFSFLDIGNLKFRFPRLHGWYYCRKHSNAEYQYRYVSNPDGLVGDISAEKRWHEHFSRPKLEKLLNDSGFIVVGFDGSGFFSRVIKAINFLSEWFKPLRPLIRRISAVDAKSFESTNLFCAARKRRRSKAKEC